MSAEEEREFLLRSLDDLEAEHEAGDLADEDYETLRDGYTARAAEVLRSIDEGAGEAPPPLKTRWSKRSLLAGVGVVALAVVAGVVLARSVGTRGEGDTATGGIGGSVRDRLAACQPLSMQDPAKGIDCYDDLLADHSDNPEALTYRGWAKVRKGDLLGGQADFDRVVELDPTFPDVYVFRAVAEKRREDWAAAAKELDTFFSLNPPPGPVSTLEQMGTEYEIRYRLLDPSVRACYDKAQAVLGAATSSTTTTVPPGADPDNLVDVFRCLDAVIEERPADVDPLLLRGFLLATSGSATLATQARQTLDRAVTVAPRDPTARLMRAAFLAENGDPKGAIEDLDAMKGLGRPSVLYGLAPADDIRAAAEKQLDG